MRFLGFTPKILATSVALHATALASFGYFQPAGSLFAKPGAVSAVGFSTVGLRLIDSGSQSAAAGTTISDHQSKLVVAAGQPRRHSSAAIKAPQHHADSKPETSPSTTEQASHESAEGGNQASSEAAGDGFEPTSGLRLVASSIIMPPYTDDARIKRFEGTLVVEVTTDAEGRVTEAKLKNPSGLDLDAGVLAAARRALYEPPQGSEGNQTAGRARLKFRFHLEPETL